MRKEVMLFIVLSVIFSLLFSVNVLADEGLTSANSDLNGFYNLSEYENLSGNEINTFNEAPLLKDKVKTGVLPPVEERLPDVPLIQIPWEQVGRYGGTLRWDEVLTDFDRFLRHMNSAQLLELPPSSAYHPRSGVVGPTVAGVISEWEIGPEAKVYIFKIREGLKWSDGVPVTTDDVRFCVEDVLLNKEINPISPEWLRWGGEMTEFEVLDKYTFKFTFSHPYGVFIQDIIRGSTFWNLIKPKHYLQQYHKKYTSWEKLLPKMEKREYTDKASWGNFYSDFDTQGDGGAIIKLANPEEYPTLNPYVVKEVKDNENWTFERNPYFYMVDTKGNQLPYIDKLHRQYVSNPEMISMDVIQGKTDLQGMITNLADYPLYKKNEEKGDYYVLPLKNDRLQAITLFLNLCPEDPVLRELVQDVRFRQALSLALNRERFRESIFLGFGELSQIAPPPGDIHYEEKYTNAYADYNLQKANELLDELGLKWDKDKKYRLRPDGERLSLEFLYYETGPMSTPGAELASKDWEELGIEVPVKHVNGNYFWENQGANKHVLSVWRIHSQNVTAGGASPGFFPITTPKWNQWYNTDGKEGVEPLSDAKKMYELREIILSTPSDEKRLQARKEMWELQAKNLWLIGTVTDTPIPFVFNKKLGNIAIAKEYNYDRLTVLEAAEQWFFNE